MHRPCPPSLLSLAGAGAPHMPWVSPSLCTPLFPPPKRFAKQHHGQVVPGPGLCPMGKCHSAGVQARGRAIPLGRAGSVGPRGTARCPVGTAWCPGGRHPGASWGQHCTPWGQPGAQEGTAQHQHPAVPRAKPIPIPTGPRAQPCPCPRVSPSGLGQRAASVLPVTGCTAQLCPDTPWPWADVAATTDTSRG